MVGRPDCEWPVSEASGGRICNEKKAQVRSTPPSGANRAMADRAGRRGFSSCGHRLGSLYRGASRRESRLTTDYHEGASPASSRFKYGIPEAVAGAKGGLER